MGPTTGRPDADAAEFLEFLQRCHDALRQHTGGNPRPYLELWSHADDVSLMGGVGGHQVGINEVSESTHSQDAQLRNLERREPRHRFRRYVRFHSRA